MKTKNTFDKGLITDLNPLITPNNCLTDALNGTLITYNGNEFMLLNDMGNGLVETAYLPEGYIPIGVCSLGGIIYIASYNPLTNRGLIGSFPSPERDMGSEENNNDEITFALGEMVKDNEDEKINIIGINGSIDVQDFSYYTKIGTQVDEFENVLVTPFTIGEFPDKKILNLDKNRILRIFTKAEINPGDLFKITSDDIIKPSKADNNLNNVSKGKDIIWDFKLYKKIFDKVNYNTEINSNRNGLPIVDIKPIIVFDSGKFKELLYVVDRENEFEYHILPSINNFFDRSNSTKWNVVNSDSKGNLGLSYSIKSPSDFQVSFYLNQSKDTPEVNTVITHIGDKYKSLRLEIIDETKGEKVGEGYIFPKSENNNREYTFGKEWDCLNTTLDKLIQDKTVHTFKITPSITENNIFIPWLTKTFTINYSLESTGELNLTKWRYLQTEDEQSLNFSIEGSPNPWNSLTKIKLYTKLLDLNLYTSLLNKSNKEQIGLKNFKYDDNNLDGININSDESIVVYEKDFNASIKFNLEETIQIKLDDEENINLKSSLKKNSLYLCLFNCYYKDLKTIKSFYRLMYTSNIWNNYYGLYNYIDFDDIDLDLNYEFNFNNLLKIPLDVLTESCTIPDIIKKDFDSIQSSFNINFPSNIRIPYNLNIYNSDNIDLSKVFLIFTNNSINFKILHINPISNDIKYTSGNLRFNVKDNNFIIKGLYSIKILFDVINLSNYTNFYSELPEDSIENFKNFRTRLYNKDYKVFITASTTDEVNNIRDPYNNLPKKIKDLRDNHLTCYTLKNELITDKLDYLNKSWKNEFITDNDYSMVYTQVENASIVWKNFRESIHVDTIPFNDLNSKEFLKNISYFVTIGSYGGDDPDSKLSIYGLRNGILDNDKKLDFYYTDLNLNSLLTNILKNVLIEGIENYVYVFNKMLEKKLFYPFEKYSEYTYNNIKYEPIIDVDLKSLDLKINSVDIDKDNITIIVNNNLNLTEESKYIPNLHINKSIIQFKDLFLITNLNSNININVEPSYCARFGIKNNLEFKIFYTKDFNKHYTIKNDKYIKIFKRGISHRLDYTNNDHTEYRRSEDLLLNRSYLANKKVKYPYNELESDDVLIIINESTGEGINRSIMPIVFDNYMYDSKQLNDEVTPAI